MLFDVETRKIPFDQQTLLIQLRAADPGFRFTLDPAATPTDLDLKVLDWEAPKELTVTPGAPGRPMI